MKQFLEIEDVAVVGVLLAVIAVLIYFIIKLRKEADERDDKIDQIHEKRLQEQKEFTKDLLEISSKVISALSQLYEMLSTKK